MEQTNILNMCWSFLSTMKSSETASNQRRMVSTAASPAPLTRRTPHDEEEEEEELWGEEGGERWRSIKTRSCTTHEKFIPSCCLHARISSEVPAPPSRRGARCRVKNCCRPQEDYKCRRELRPAGAPTSWQTSTVCLEGTETAAVL